MAEQELKFKVAPHIVEDLGLNLYTNLPRVLVEFIANAYDADSPHAMITLDIAEIEKARAVLKAEWDCEKQKAENSEDVTRLAEQVLPDGITIVIEDAGHGMSRSDLQEKFLIAGRRRRGRDNSECQSPKGRLLMGRKGLGKLAGFGVAQIVTVITRAEGETHATEIELDYRDLILVENTDEIPIKDRVLNDGGGFPDG